MKKSLIYVASLFFSIQIFAQSNTEEITISTKPEKVTVYISGAQVEAKGTAILKSSTKTVVFENLSNFIDANSIQVKADADITILSVNYRMNYLQPTDNKDFKLLEDSLITYRKEISRVALQKNAYQEELTLMQSNRSIGGSNVGVSTSELQKMADFIRIRFNEVSLKKLETEEKEQKIKERITKIEQQLITLRNQGVRPTGEVVVQLANSSAGTANFELTYYLTNCGWVPMYDIRVKDTNTPASITAKANVYQNTGQEWKNVKLSLSTGNPSRSNTKPAINPWSLYLYDRSTTKARYKMTQKSMAMDDAEPASYEGRAEKMESRSLSEVQIAGVTRQPSKTGAAYTSVNTTTTNAVFDIKIPYTVSSNGKDNIIEIQKYEVAANYAYFAIPKVDKDAFLVADLIGWDQNELLPGDANVYFENNFVGKTFFDSRIVDDTLSFALGRDNNVRVQLKQVKDLNEKVSLSGNSTKITRLFEIELKNTRKSAITIEIEDQIPLTTNSELSIDKIGAEDAVYDKTTGKLTWKINLAAGESKKLNFGYSLRFPKKYRLEGL
jgi:uncharacterized protein (TIGR02231 family)